MPSLANITGFTILQLHGEPCRITRKSDPDNPVMARCVVKASLEQAISNRALVSQYEVTLEKTIGLAGGDMVEVLDSEGNTLRKVGITRPMANMRYLAKYAGVEQQ